MKKTIFVISILFLTNALKAQWTWQYNYLYSEPEIPDWYFKLDNKLDKIAILPFTGYSFQDEALARQIESEIRSKLLAIGEFTLIEREYLMDIIREKHISLGTIGNNEVEVFKKFIDADVLIVGSITNYREEENYVSYVKGNQYACDEYKRTVSIDFNFRIIKVNDGSIVFEKTYTPSYYKTGYKNVRQIYSTYNNSTLGQINQVLGSTLDIAIVASSNKMPEFSYLSEYCVNDIVSNVYIELVPLKREYKESWQYNVKNYKKRNYSKTYLGEVFDKESMNSIRFIDDIFEDNSVHLSDTILYESFLENKRSWLIEDDENRFFKFMQGRYYIQSKKENSFSESSYSISTSNYMISLNLRYEDGATDNTSYIKFRSGNKRYYVCIDASGDSYFKIASLGSEWQDIKGWTKSDLIKSNEDNKIDIIIIYYKMYLFINGRFVFEKNDIPYSDSNQIGLGSGNAKYSFDNLLITKIE